MKTSRTATLLLASAASALALSACGSGVTSSTAPVSAGAITIENCGRELSLPGSPTATVGLSPAQTELLLRLGLEHTLVGQAQTQMASLPDDLLPLVAEVPVLGTDGPPSREDLLNVGPDFVFAPTTYEFTAEQGFASLEQLDEAGVLAYVATGGCFDRRMEGTVDDIFIDLENLGTIFGIEDAAAALIEEGKAELAAVESAIAGHERPSVAQLYVEGGTLGAIGAGIEYDIITLAGGDNVFSPDDPAFADFFAAQISPESLAAANPEVIVFAASNPEHERATRAYLQATFPQLAAVATDRVYAIAVPDTFPGTLGNISVVTELAEHFHPEAFSE